MLFNSFKLITSTLNKRVTLLFGIAALSRTVVALLQIFSGIKSVPASPLGAWSDFYSIYGIDLHSLSSGLLPYKDFGYWYPPLFLYVLYMFYVIGGLHAASIPVILADSATAPLIYSLAAFSAGKRVAFASGLLYALLPVALVEEGYLWLSSQPMTLLLLLSIYLLLRNYPILSSLILAVSILFKQEAVFILPVYVFWYAFRGRSKMKKGFTVFVFSLFLASLPFLVISPSYRTIEDLGK